MSGSGSFSRWWAASPREANQASKDWAACQASALYFLLIMARDFTAPPELTINLILDNFYNIALRRCCLNFTGKEY
jgi:hypothetical protein